MRTMCREVLKVADHQWMERGGQRNSTTSGIVMAFVFRYISALVVFDMSMFGRIAEKCRK